MIWITTSTTQEVIAEGYPLHGDTVTWELDKDAVGGWVSDEGSLDRLHLEVVMALTGLSKVDLREASKRHQALGIETVGTVAEILQPEGASDE